MSNFQLTPGDKYDGRCAEIYITEKQFLVYHCSVCEEIYGNFNALLRHLTNEHYENANEYQYEETLKVEIQILRDEEEVVVKDIGNTVNTVCQYQVENKYLDSTNNSEEFLDIEVDDKGAFTDEQEGINDSHFQNPSSHSMLGEITVLEEPKKMKVHQYSVDTSNNTAQRKKIRAVTGMLKSNVITRTKLKPLSRYQPNSLPKVNGVDRKYVCGICGFAFKERCNLRSHLLRHSNQKDFTCSLCTKKFFTKMELRIHEYRHKGVRPYLCNHCGVGFVCSSSLTQHVKKQHSLHRPFKCEECDKSFTNAYLLKNHMVSHSDERSFQCTECTASFKVKKTLDKHLKIHINKRNLRCDYCDLGFGTESALKTHRRNKHGNYEAFDEVKLVEEKQVVENCEQNELENSEQNEFENSEQNELENSEQNELENSEQNELENSEQNELESLVISFM